MEVDCGLWTKQQGTMDVPASDSSATCNQTATQAEGLQVRSTHNGLRLPQVQLLIRQ